MGFLFSVNCASLKEDSVGRGLFSVNCPSLKEDPVGRDFFFLNCASLKEDRVGWVFIFSKLRYFEGGPCRSAFLSMSR